VVGDVCAFFQDHDGSHIKGLIINLLYHIWPGLLQIDGFLTEFVTPIVKVPTGTFVLWACGIAPGLDSSFPHLHILW
jgi:hypothetical protein